MEQTLTKPASYTDCHNRYLAQAQKALATTIARGETLLTTGLNGYGYSIEAYPHRPGVYSVARSANDPRPLQKGETLWNDVDIVHQDCTCRAFETHGNCKHLIAANKAVADAARLIGPMLPGFTVATVNTVATLEATATVKPAPVVATVAAKSPVKPAFPTYGSAAWKQKVAADFD